MLAGCGGSQPPIGAPGAMAQAPDNKAQSKTFKFTGAAQTFVVPNNVTAITVTAYGASGGKDGPGTMPQSLATARGDGKNYRVVYDFGRPPDGQEPFAGLIDVGGTFYGTTPYGGKSGTGTVFSTSERGAEKVLYSFRAGGDGINPFSGLIDVGGTFYGTTMKGGSYSNSYCAYHCGTVFSITPSGTEKILYSFGRKGDGAHPYASLINVKGTLYGTTHDGGTFNSNCRYYYGCGTVFSITPSGTEKILYSFGGGQDGSYPRASLIEIKGTLYGTTQSGGEYHGGTVFSITRSGVEKVLHSFGAGSDGDVPYASLIDVKGTLYGTTTLGGAPSCNGLGQCGTVFSITPSGTEKVIHRFAANGDGGSPFASLIDVKGTLYGTTVYGGAYSCTFGGGCGTVFSITTSGKERALHSFGSVSDADGVFPTASLIYVNGKLYGTTNIGGTTGEGTVFSLKP
jgi:uncharacterized repeat protein (TIGR03803 family)